MLNSLQYAIVMPDSVLLSLIEEPVFKFVFSLVASFLNISNFLYSGQIISNFSGVETILYLGNQGLMFMF